MVNERKYYRKHMKLKTVLSTVLLVLLTVIVLLVLTFLWFKRYIVYTEDGLYLDVPWLREDTPPDSGDDTQFSGDEPDGDNTVPDEPVPPDAPIDTPNDTPSDTPVDDAPTVE